MPDSANLQVLIPYRDLEALLAAARELPALHTELIRCHEQIAALRTIQAETMDKYLELYKMI